MYQCGYHKSLSLPQFSSIVRRLGGEVWSRVLDEERVADVADLGGPAGGPAGHRLGDAVGAEDAAAVAAVVLPPVGRQGALAVLARRHVVLVLPSDLWRSIRGLQYK